MGLLNIAISSTLVTTDHRIASRLFSEEAPGYGMNSSLLYLLYFYLQREMVYHSFRILIWAAVIHVALLTSVGVTVSLMADV
jgi:hypothetical protein